MCVCVCVWARGTPRRNANYGTECWNARERQERQNAKQERHRLNATQERKNGTHERHNGMPGILAWHSGMPGIPGGPDEELALKQLYLIRFMLHVNEYHDGRITMVVAGLRWAVFIIFV